MNIVLETNAKSPGWTMHKQRGCVTLGSGGYDEKEAEKTAGRIAIVVQRLIRADFSGVLFTADPVTGDLILTLAMRMS